MGAIYGTYAFGKNLADNPAYSNGNWKTCEECALYGETTLSEICEGYQFLIAFSGKLDGSDALVLKLSAYGYQFNEKTDAEVALFTYIHFGEDSKNLLFGKFSMIIYDSMRHQVFAYSASEDFPLFYRKTKYKIIVSSHISSLLETDKEELSLSSETLSPYLMGTSVYPEEIFNDVFLISCGNALKIKNNSLSISYTPKSTAPQAYKENHIEAEKLIPKNFSEQELFNSICECVKIAGAPLVSYCDFLIPLIDNASSLLLHKFSFNAMPFLEENNFYYDAVLKTLMPLDCRDFSSLTSETMLMLQYNITGFITDCEENINTEAAKKLLVPLRRILLGIIANNSSPILAFFKRHTLLSFCEGAYPINIEHEIALLSYFIKLNIWLLEYKPKII